MSSPPRAAINHSCTSGNNPLRNIDIGVISRTYGVETPKVTCLVAPMLRRIARILFK